MKTKEEKVLTIYREICRRLALNNFSTTIKMKNTGRKFSISSGKTWVLLFTDPDTNKDGEVIWKTQIKGVKTLHDVAEYIYNVAC